MTSKLRVMLEAAVFSSLAMLLSFIPLNIGTGIDIAIGIIPILIYSFRRGVVAGVGAGFLWGMLHIILGKAYILTPSQGFIEYVVAFSVPGIAGILSFNIQKNIISESNQAKRYIIMGTLLAVFLKGVCHFVAGVLFWGAYAVGGMSPFIYSLVMNGISTILTIIVSLIIILRMYSKHPSLFEK